MIILVQDRKSNFHLSDYTSPSGNHYTICGLIYKKGQIINTLALDGAVSDFCRTCYEDYEKLYGRTLNKEPRLAKSHTQLMIYSKVHNVCTGVESPQNKYWFLEERYSNKINQYHRKLMRK